MIPAAFDYARAGSLAEVIDLLQRDPEGTRLVAGGHTLIPTLKLRLASPVLLVDIRGIAEMKGISIDDKTIRIGALTTHAELLASEALHALLPIFRQTANRIADPQVRNRGTIGGSLANADPAADWPAVVIALHAEFEIAGPKGARRVAARDFFVDIFSTVLEPSEVLAAVHLRRPTLGARFTYRKIRHPASGYAVVAWRPACAWKPVWLRRCRSASRALRSMLFPVMPQRNSWWRSHYPARRSRKLRGSSAKRPNVFQTTTRPRSIVRALSGRKQGAPYLRLRHEGGEASAISPGWATSPNRFRLNGTAPEPAITSISSRRSGLPLAFSNFG